MGNSQPIPLNDDSVWQILEDGKGNLWMSCNNGIFRVSMRELNDFAKGKISSINSISYGEPDGMMSKECNGGFQPAGWKSRDGKLWFPTIRGVVMINPENIRTNKLSPPVLIEQVIIDNRSFAASGVIQISPGNKDFEFHYTGLSFLAPGRVKFKYKLEGWNKEWIDAGTRRTAYYTNIPPGSYCFRVIACNNDGIWNEEGASLKIIVPPPFWQTWWFRVLLVLSILSAVIFIYKLRTRAIRRRNEELNKLNIRLEISEEKYRSLFEKSRDVIYLRTADGKLLDINSAGEKLLGYSRDKMIGNNVSLFYANSNDVQKFNQEIIKNGHVQDFEEKLQCEDGRVLDCIVTASIRKTNKGQSLYHGIIRDITEKKKTEEELRKHREHLEELVKERTSELEEKNKELERFNKLFVNREFRIKELRDKVKELEKRNSS